MVNKKKSDKIKKIYHKINSNLKKYRKNIHKNLNKMSRIKESKKMNKTKTKTKNKLNNNRIPMIMLLFNNKTIFKENLYSNMNTLNKLKICFLILRDKM